MPRSCSRLVTLLTLCFAACGGQDDGGERDKPSSAGNAAAKKVIAEFYVAVQASDGEQACGLLTTALVKELDQPPDRCAKEVLYATVGSEAPRDPQVTEVRTRGDRGNVVVTTRRGHGGAERLYSQDIQVEKVGASWRIAAFPEPPRPL